MAEVKAKAIAKPVAKAADAKVAETKAAETKTAEKPAAAKEETKKAAAKTTTKTTAKKAPAKKAPAKKAPAKKATTTTRKAAAKTVVNFQFSGKSYTTDDLVKIAKDVWVYDLNKDLKDFKSVELYVKPEESAAYYVVNEEVTGSFGI